MPSRNTKRSPFVSCQGALPQKETRMPRATFETAADLLERLGRIDPRRVRVNPPPGQATERDLIRLNDHSNRLYELVDGVLVEKVMGFPESMLALWIGYLIQRFLQEHDL